MNAAEIWRCFWGAALDEPSKSAVRAALEFLNLGGDETPGSSFRWIKPGNWHMTLCFLGNVSTEHARQLAQFDGSQQPKAPISLRMAGCEPFPTRRPTVLAIRFERNPVIDQWVRLLGDRARTLDVPFDHRPFRPHLTLARIKGKSPRNVVWPNLTLPSELTFDCICLFRSVLDSHGATYQSLADIQLKA